MRMLDLLLGKKKDKDIQNWSQFQTVSEPSPMVVSWNRHIYEQQLVRSIIERIALACSKLEPKIHGNSKPRIRRAVETSPNQFQTWPQFLHRCATIYYNDNDLFIVPTFKEGTDTVIGFYPVRSVATEIVMYDGEPWIRLNTPSGQPLAIELKQVAILTRFQYKSDFFGTPNNLDDTLALLKIQAEAQKDAIKNTGRIQFIAQANGQVREDDLIKKRDRFAEANLSDVNRSGLMAYDNTFVNVTQVDPKNWTIPTAEMERIENNIFDYFGVNRKILQNDYDEGTWDAFYEGVVEPWAIQLGESLSQSLFTMRERPNNRIEFSSDRLAYASASTKRNMNKDMLDRGVMTINQALKNLQLPELGPDGDIRILRGEYKVGYTFNELLDTQRAQVEAAGIAGSGETDVKDIDPSDADIQRPDSEGYGEGGDTDNSDASTTKQDRWE